VLTLLTTVMLSPADLAWGVKLLDVLVNSRNYNRAKFFLAPVITALAPEEWKDYRKEIANPKDLGTIRTDLEANTVYATVDALVNDVNLCFENSIVYNTSRYPQVAEAAAGLKKVC
jgi:hypothetical protein